MPTFTFIEPGDCVHNYQADSEGKQRCRVCGYKQPSSGLTSTQWVWRTITNSSNVINYHFQ